MMSNYLNTNSRVEIVNRPIKVLHAIGSLSKGGLNFSVACWLIILTLKNMMYRSYVLMEGLIRISCLMCAQSMSIVVQGGMC